MSAAIRPARTLAVTAALLCCSAYAFAQPSCSSSYRVDATLATGSRWQMCWEQRSREGIVLHDIYFTPAAGMARRVLGKAGVAQIHVPYDDDGARYHDVSDYGIGGAKMIDLAGGDCPGGTLLRDGDKDVLCQQITRRGHAHTGHGEQRQGHALSLFSVSRVGEYNYVAQWRFFDDGTIEPAMGATGKLQRTGGPSAHGWPLSSGTIGISHLHNYYWRLDFDLGEDGNDDVVEELDFVAGGDGRRQRTLTRLWSEAARSSNPERMRRWRIRDDAIVNDDGHAVSYELLPLETGHRGRGPSYEPFTENDFYVTVYRSCERYASHNPASGGCSDDVAAFVNGESLAGADLVVWFGLAFHHIPRAEDAPRMNAHWNRFQIVPRDWSAENPLSSDLPPANEPPSLANPGAQNDAEGDSVSLALNASDPEGDALTFSAIGLPGGLSIDTRTGAITGTLAAASAGSYPVTARASDGAGEATATFNWTVTARPPPNQAPALANPGAQQSNEGDPVTLVLNATDPEDDALSYSVSGLPGGLSVNSSTGVISGSLAAGSAGSYTVRATVSDGASDDQISFEWTVSALPSGCGPLVQEAEDGELSGNFTRGDEPSASGGQFVHVPNGTAGAGGASSPHRAEYCFTVSSPGRYRIRGWVRGESGYDDSFYVRVNGSRAYLWDTRVSATYVGEYVSHRGGADPVEVTLRAGEHRVVVYLREDGARLDKLELEQVVDTVSPSSAVSR